MPGLSSGQEERAAKLVSEAEKILSKKGFFSTLLGSSSSQRYEDAADLFRKAATCLKVVRKWEEAGDLFIRAAELEDKAGESAHQAANAYMEASKCYKSADITGKATTASQAAQERFLEMGRFTQVAKMLKETAEVYEKEGSYKEAVEAFQQASDYFSGEKSIQGSNQCKVKVAMLVSKDLDPPEYQRAGQLFEELGISCADTPLLRMNAKGHFMNACMCMMASGDMVAVSQKLDEYKSIDHTFANSRECKFLEELAAAVDEFDHERFSTAAFEFDRVTSLDPWKTAVLLSIKRQIDGGDNDGEDVDLT